MADMFFYGTLRDADVLSTVLGCDCPVEAAFIEGATAYRVAGAVYPALIKENGGRATGVVARNLSGRDVDRLSFFEDIGDYHLEALSVHTESGPVLAQIYIPNDPSIVSAEEWSLDRWRTAHKPAFVEVAKEVMDHYGHVRSDEVHHLWHGIRIRALARAAAEAEVRRPSALGGGYTRADVEVAARTRPYADYYGIEDYRLTHKLEDGGMSEAMSRAVLVSGDAVTVLPYDPKRREVVLVEQFRVGPYARGDHAPWMLEPIAGRMDADESPQDTARREAREEAGLEITQLEHLSSFYPSPGTVTEYMHSFVGVVDLAGYDGGNFGLEHEGEHIQAIVVPLDAALAAVKTGEIAVGPLVLSLFWLEANASRLSAL